MTKADTLRKNYKDAVEYVGYIGRTQHHLKSAGKLSTCKVQTEINFQHDMGTTNYWKNSEFDNALEAVIRSNFARFASDALFLMKLNADESLLEEEQALRERLEEIEFIKKGKS